MTLLCICPASYLASNPTSMLLCEAPAMIHPIYRNLLSNGLCSWKISMFQLQDCKAAKFPRSGLQSVTGLKAEPGGICGHLPSPCLLKWLPFHCTSTESCKTASEMAIYFLKIDHASKSFLAQSNLCGSE